METIIKVNLRMEHLMDMVNIFGMMVAILKEILGTDKDLVMVNGIKIKNQNSHTKEHIE